MHCRLFLAASLLLSPCSALAIDLAVPVEGGEIILREIQVNDVSASMTIINSSVYSWRSLLIRFDMSADCVGVRRDWSAELLTSLGFLKDRPISRVYHEFLINRKGSGCQAQTIKAELVSAERLPDETKSFSELVEEIRAEREATQERLERESAAGKAEIEARTAENLREAEARDRERRARAQAEAARLSKLPTLVNNMVGVFVADDVKCSKEYSDALGMSGLEQRRRLTELLSFGCGVVADKGVHVSIVESQGTYSFIRIEEGSLTTKTGWVPTLWVRQPVVSNSPNTTNGGAPRGIKGKSK